MHQLTPDAVRTKQIAELRQRPLDVLIIGGGIVGAGVARDAAMRGLRTGLVEKHDLAFGTSSRSSRLLHGGLRYLAQGRLGLVYEASHEKLILHRIAPHLAEPLPFLFPAYRGTPWPRWKLAVGVKVYDLLCGRRNLGRSQSLSPAAVRKLLPGIRGTNLIGAVRYFDDLTNDARLVIDTLSSAARQGANVLNYVEYLDGAADGAMWQCRIRDVLGGEDSLLAARCVVNATGPWAAAIPHNKLRLRLTKGVHLVIDRQRLPLPSAVVMTAGSRILFGIPWGQRIILGTTDTDYDGSPEAVTTDEADVAYLLEIVNTSFPAAALTPADVIRTWAGVRPLIDTRPATGYPGGPSDISRAHQIRMPESGWFDVAGGKLTTYRRIAQQVVDRIVSYQRRKAKPCRTAIEPLRMPGQAELSSGILPPPVSADLVEHYCRHEWAVHLDDVMIRRTSWHYYHADAAKIACDVVGWMAAVLGWDMARQAAEVERYLK
ncbi:MAG: glycerol-3-phosphate dehydrogenase/oxidase [Thermoguttaceae bacterium]